MPFWTERGWNVGGPWSDRGWRLSVCLLEVIEVGDLVYASLEWNKLTWHCPGWHCFLATSLCCVRSAPTLRRKELVGGRVVGWLLHCHDAPWISHHLWTVSSFMTGTQLSFYYVAIILSIPRQQQKSVNRFDCSCTINITLTGEVVCEHKEVLWTLKLLQWEAFKIVTQQ